MSFGVRRVSEGPQVASLPSIDVTALPESAARIVESDAQLRGMVGSDHVIRDVPGFFARLQELDRTRPEGSGGASLSRADQMMQALRIDGAGLPSTTGLGASAARTRQGIFATAAPQPSAETAVRATSNDQLVAMAETPQGRAQLAAWSAQLRAGPMTPAKQEQLARIESATFTPGPGLRLTGSAADQASYLRMTRLAMLESPSFARLMRDTSADAAHPVTINVERNTNTKLDSFARSAVDVGDLESLPPRPEAGRPEQITRGEVLAHMMREQRAKALGSEYGPAHAAAITAENDYRRDIGQRSMRLLPPNDETRSSDAYGTFITIHFDDQHHEAILFDTNGRLNGTAAYGGAGAGAGAAPGAAPGGSAGTPAVGSSSKSK